MKNTRRLSTTRRVEAPTYARDIVGAIQPVDERDVLFARADLFRYFGVESAAFRAYYAAHPEYQNYDAKMNQPPGLGLGRTGQNDAAMFDAQFAALDWISPDALVDGEPNPRRIEFSPERGAQKVKALARFLGADLVGIGPLRPEWVYSHVGRSFGDKPGFQPRGTPVDLPHPTAIALGIRMDYDLTQCAPDFPTLLATAKGYATSAWVAIQLAEYIRELGYSARAHHFHNYRLLCVPVAVDCGLGELSRAGYLLTKEFGLAVRLAAVTTTMPLAQDRPVDIGAQSFCATCKLCAEHCPIGAIPSGEKVEGNGVRKWRLDAEKCYRYWKAVGSDCGLCMSVCPWTKPPTRFHQMMAHLAARKGPHQRWLTRADQWFYGRGKGQSRPRPDFIDPPQRTNRG